MVLPPGARRGRSHSGYPEQDRDHRLAGASGARGAQHLRSARARV